MATGRGPRPRPEDAIAVAVGRVSVVLLPLIVLLPWLRRWDTLGFHDWDAMTAHRELVRRTLVVHGELPWWNPWACGGFPAWGYIEGATVVVSPWLALYLLLPMAVALRLEVLGAALVGAWGAWAAAGRLTPAPAARALVVAVWAVNGRWALQAAAGHTWHLAYALTPWCLVALEHARTRGGARAHALLGAALALLVYHGGIYPLPHTVLLLAIYAAAVAALERSLLPLRALAIGGALGVALAAPKLLPMLATFGRAPRLVASTETFPLTALWAALTSRAQGFFDRPAPVRPYGWHEWGSYVGVVPLLLLAIGIGASVAARDRRAIALALAGIALAVLALGAFHPLAPWTLTHAHVPFFRSMHVPSRFLHPALLALALAAAPGLARLLSRAADAGGRAWIAPFAAAFAAGVGIDVAMVAQKPMAQAMWMKLPSSLRQRPFEHRTEPPVGYVRRDWASPLYPSMLAGVGVLHCYGTPPFDGQGARGADAPGYRGLVEITGEEGTSELVRWSPNGIEVAVRGAPAGARLIYDMNFDRGWSATVEVDGQSVERAAVADADRVAVDLPPGEARVALRYRPPHLGLGVAAAAVAAAALVAWRLRERRAAAVATGEGTPA